MDYEKVKRATQLLLEGLGEDPKRHGLKDTPDRVARMYQEICRGLMEDPRTYLKTSFAEDHDEIVLVKDIPMYSLCEHHLVPFFGKAHVAYIPKKGKVVGLSKLIRAVEALSRRPQIQEKLTKQIADVVVESLDPKGVIVVIEAEHMCMTMRGVNKPGAFVETSAVRGIFKRRRATREEALLLIKGKR